METATWRCIRRAVMEEVVYCFECLGTCVAKFILGDVVVEIIVSRANAEKYGCSFSGVGELWLWWRIAELWT